MEAVARDFALALAWRGNADALHGATKRIIGKVEYRKEIIQFY